MNQPPSAIASAMPATEPIATPPNPAESRLCATARISSAVNPYEIPAAVLNARPRTGAWERAATSASATTASMTGNAARSPALGGTVEAVTLPLASSRKITTPAVLAAIARMAGGVSARQVTRALMIAVRPSASTPTGWTTVRGAIPSATACRTAPTDDDPTPSHQRGMRSNEPSELGRRASPVRTSPTPWCCRVTPTAKQHAPRTASRMPSPIMPAGPVRHYRPVPLVRLVRHPRRWPAAARTGTGSGPARPGRGSAGRRTGRPSAYRGTATAHC